MLESFVFKACTGSALSVHWVCTERALEVDTNPGSTDDETTHTTMLLFFQLDKRLHSGNCLRFAAPAEAAWKLRGLAAQRLRGQGTWKVEEATHPCSRIVNSLGS